MEHKFKILIIDDSSACRMAVQAVFSRICRKHGMCVDDTFEFGECDYLDCAIEQMKIIWDMILIDVCYYRTWELQYEGDNNSTFRVFLDENLLQWMRDKQPRANIVVMSGIVWPELAASYISHGADEYCMKNDHEDDFKNIDTVIELFVDETAILQRKL